MISVQEALETLHNNIPEPVPRLVSLEQAYNCYPSEDITAPESSPRYTNSAMDGYIILGPSEILEAIDLVEVILF